MLTVSTSILRVNGVRKMLLPRDIATKVVIVTNDNPSRLVLQWQLIASFWIKNL